MRSRRRGVFLTAGCAIRPHTAGRQRRGRRRAARRVSPRRLTTRTTARVRGSNTDAARNWLTLLSQPHCYARMLLIGDAKALTRASSSLGGSEPASWPSLAGAPSSAGTWLSCWHRAAELLGALLRLACSQGTVVRRRALSDHRRSARRRSSARAATPRGHTEEMTTIYSAVAEHLPATLRGGPLADYLEASAELVRARHRGLERSSRNSSIT